MGTKTLFARSAIVCLVAASMVRAADDGLQLPLLPPATTVQLPSFGINIDADGVLDVRARAAVDPQLVAERWAAARAARPGNLFAASKLRKVSLVRLERDLKRLLATGAAPDEAMKNLAGLTRLHYIFCYPPQGEQPGDVIIAGAAEPFVTDASGRVVGLLTGRPALQLEDFAVALRAFAPGGRDRPRLGCSIDPPAAGLARLIEFQRTIPRNIPQSEQTARGAQIAEGVAASLGQAEIRVFGLPATTHFAQVLVEADYRMKRIGIGLEAPPVRMTTFVEALQAPPQGLLGRWWFVPDYRCVRLSDDHLAAELVGQGLQLLGEDKTIRADGSLADTGNRPSKASEIFTLGFTRKYPQIAAASPVYAQLRSLVDLAVAGAVLRRHDFYARAGWQADALRDEMSLPLETRDTPRSVACVVNSLWKGNRLLVPAGGGVSIEPDEALEAKNLLPDTGGAVDKLRQALSPAPAAATWWWD